MPPSHLFDTDPRSPAPVLRETLLAWAGQLPEAELRRVFSMMTSYDATDEEGRELAYRMIEDQTVYEITDALAEAAPRPQRTSLGRLVRSYMDEIHRQDNLDPSNDLIGFVHLALSVFSAHEAPPPVAVNMLVGKVRFMIEDSYGDALSPESRRLVREMVLTCLAHQQDLRDQHRGVVTTGMLRLVRERLQPVWEREGMIPDTAIESALAQRLDDLRRSLPAGIDAQIEVVAAESEAAQRQVAGEGHLDEASTLGIRALVAEALSGTLTLEYRLKGSFLEPEPEASRTAYEHLDE